MKRIAILALVLLIASVAWAQPSSLDSYRWKISSIVEKNAVCSGLFHGFSAAMGAIAGYDPWADALLNSLIPSGDVRLSSIAEYIDAFYSDHQNREASLSRAFIFSLLAFNQADASD